MGDMDGLSRAERWGGSPRLWLSPILTTIGLVMYWAGSVIAFGLWTTLLVMALVGGLVAVGIVRGLRLRRERGSRPVPESQARDEARDTAATLRRSLIVHVVAAPLLAVAAVYYLGFDPGTGLMAGGLVVLLAGSVATWRQLNLGP